VSLKVGGDDLSGKAGLNASLGLVHDGRRNLFCAVVTDSKVYALRPDTGSAVVRLLE
jgi:hypothetical protein